MERTRILVNDAWVRPLSGPGTPALDFIRGQMGLKGTKEGCREGDCGACAVLVGGPGPEGPVYRALPSCLLALGELEGKHLLTIEGLRAVGRGRKPGQAAASEEEAELTPVMRAFLEENATQCGFCTPGFIIALTAWLCAPGPKEIAGALRAVDGNLCRCTGYSSIRRAAERLVREFSDLPKEGMARLEALVGAGVLPGSVLDYARSAEGREARGRAAPTTAQAPYLGGGTDYFVRNPDPGEDFAPIMLSENAALSGFRTVQAPDGSPWLELGAAVTATEFFASPELRAVVPGIEAFEAQFASGLVRNLATIGGNIANASPVGDLSSLLLGLGAFLLLGDPGLSLSEARLMPLETFFLGYKRTALRPGEAILAVRLPKRDSLRLSFGKIAKRANLDIAAVNSALSFELAEGRIRSPRLSAGGVAPVPLSLPGPAALMEGFDAGRASPSGLASLARRVSEAVMAEVKPISDVRGTAEYRRRMAGRLVLHHFLSLFGDEALGKELFP